MLPDHLSPANMGLIVPETEDGRVLFFLPWESGTLCGTTDNKTPITSLPRATQQDVDFILTEASKYLKKKVQRSDVLAAWSGIRPLVIDPVQLEKLRKEEKASGATGKKKVSEIPTKMISREHIVEVNDGKMVSVMGGKWTTYRQMAQDAVDKALQLHPGIRTRAGPCITQNMMLIGSDRAHIVCDQSFDEIRITLRESFGFDRDIADHLTRNYGTRALQIGEIVKAGYPSRAAGLHPKRLHAKYPVLEAEVVFAVQQEYAMTVEDFIARRCRMAFVDQKAAIEVVPHVVNLMGTLLGWNSKMKKIQTTKAMEFLETMNVKFEDK